ncbi:type II toxin-antitoxin system RelE/ParE family toxin [Parvularcula sp. IMCC14364]|uniref:type II toxin-antitoxin system RelE/ParE family toxin n=1 Tax=Parvularcula sp. IMCC14364 TaxID=3067902 RepID=UPI002740FFDD|nr:type II toxin-antitoxin system RelE/ParE family toxin [Parvularcula sp. IMCC14364]
MAYNVVFSADAEKDFDLIFDFLIESYEHFGEAPDAAIDRAEEQLHHIMQSAMALSQAPFVGTLHDHIAPGLRHVTREKAIFWFDVVESNNLVRILAVFYGGQDHHRHMLIRLMGP